jgi:hypothetical protein
MSTIVYRISVLLGAILADVPVGTNLGLFWLLWALISGRFLLSRGAVFPALADGGLPADAVRRSGAALAYGRWAIQTLVRAWHQVVEQEGRWQAHCYLHSAHCRKGLCSYVRQNLPPGYARLIDGYLRQLFIDLYDTFKYAIRTSTTSCSAA